MNKRKALAVIFLAILITTLLASFVEATTPVSYRYVKWEITKKKGTESCGGKSCIQVSEFILLLDNSSVAWPGGTAASNPGGSNPGPEGFANAIDGNVNNKWLDFNFNTTVSVTTGQSILLIDTAAGHLVTFNGYKWETGNDATVRDPITWNIYGSNDSSSWDLVDLRSAETITDTRRTFTTNFQLNQVGVSTPTLSIATPTNNTNQTSTSLTLTFTATDTTNALSSCWYNVNGTTNVTISGCLNGTSNTTAITVAQGINQNVTVYSNNTLGNIGTTNKTFNIDFSAPTIAITLPANNSNLSSSTISLNISALDTGVGLDKCWYSINNTNNATFTCASNATFTTTQGYGNVTVYVNDTIGNLNSLTTFYTLDTTIPTITVNSLVNNTNQTSTTLVFNFTPLDNLQIATCKYSLNGASNVTINSCTSNVSNQTNVIVTNGLMTLQRASQTRKLWLQKVFQ